MTALKTVHQWNNLTERPTRMIFVLLPSQKTVHGVDVSEIGVPEKYLPKILHWVVEGASYLNLIPGVGSELCEWTGTWYLLGTYGANWVNQYFVWVLQRSSHFYNEPRSACNVPATPRFIPAYVLTQSHRLSTVLKGPPVAASWWHTMNLEQQWFWVILLI